MVPLAKRRQRSTVMITNLALYEELLADPVRRRRFVARVELPEQFTTPAARRHDLTVRGDCDQCLRMGFSRLEHLGHGGVLSAEPIS